MSILNVHDIHDKGDVLLYHYVYGQHKSRYKVNGVQHKSRYKVNGVHLSLHTDTDANGVQK